MCINIQYLVFSLQTYFTLYDSLWVQPHLCKWHNLTHFYGWVIFRCIYGPHLLYPFLCWWTSRLLPCPGCCKQCCSERWDACWVRWPFSRVHYSSLNKIQCSVHSLTWSLDPCTSQVLLSEHSRAVSSVKNPQCMWPLGIWKHDKSKLRHASHVIHAG